MLEDPRLLRPFVKILKNIIKSQDVIRKSTMIINCYDGSKIMLETRGVIISEAN